eukprot:255064-Pyramimonas_sp.AAC.2
MSEHPGTPRGSNPVPARSPPLTAGPAPHRAERYIHKRWSLTHSCSVERSHDLLEMIQGSEAKGDTRAAVILSSSPSASLPRVR